MIERQIKIAGIPEELAKVRAFLQQTLETAGLDDEEIYQWIWIVDEGCSNIIRHAYHNDPQRFIWITVRITNDRVEVEIQDEGEPFDPTQVPEPDLQQHRKLRKKGGLGIYILRRLVDHLSYEQKQHPQGRNRLILVKQRTYNSSTIPS